MAYKYPALSVLFPINRYVQINKIEIMITILIIYYLGSKQKSNDEGMDNGDGEWSAGRVDKWVSR